MHFITKPSDQSALCAPTLAALRGWVVALLAWFCDVLDLLPPALTRTAPVRMFIFAAKTGIARDLRASVRHLGHALIILGVARMTFTQRRSPLTAPSARGPSPEAATQSHQPPGLREPRAQAACAIVAT